MTIILRLLGDIAAIYAGCAFFLGLFYFAVRIKRREQRQWKPKPKPYVRPIIF
jgi:hypothetical protein